MNRIVLIGLSLLFWIHSSRAQEQIFRSFEMRYISDQPAANGETDFKGETSVFHTDQRVDFLKKYAQYARSFFRDSTLATQVVPGQQLAKTVQQLKPAPKPAIRNRKSLNQWLWYGYKEGQHTRSVLGLQRWHDQGGVVAEKGSLLFTDSTRVHWNFPPQAWRFSVSLQVYIPATASGFSVHLSDKGMVDFSTFGCDETGQFYFITGDEEKTQGPRLDRERWHTIKLEGDLAAERRTDHVSYNVYVDGKLVADYVPAQRVVTGGIGYARDFSSIAQVNQLSITGTSGIRIDSIYGIGYQPTGRANYPYLPATFVDETFELKFPVNHWQTLNFVDTAWHEGTLPLAHGGERYAMEDLFLRKKIYIEDFQKAYLNIESLDPSGEVWINGKIAAVIPNRHPVRLDVTDYLMKHRENIIAVKVNHFYLTKRVGEMMPHSSLDFNVGWFMGRAHLDLVGYTSIEDVFVFTRELQEKQAILETRVTLRNDHWLSAIGKLVYQLSPWFPEEGDPVLTDTLEVRPGKGSFTFSHDLLLTQPQLWTPETPVLYRLQVQWLNQEGQPIDDLVTTTGIRTLSQEGGTFRLNGKPYMANGAQIMGYRAPVEDMIRLSRCPPMEWVVRELLMVKNMNGNLLRTHVHNWEFPARGVNDPRYAEAADQLGVMLLWCPTGWIRTGRGWGDVDFEGFPKYMRQVYNHPSIIIWEAANHTQSFKQRDVTESNIYVEQVYHSIYPIDPSRLISYNSFIRHLHYGNDVGTIDQEGNPIVPADAWTAPGATRGNQDSPTGYGKEWSVLRAYPGPYRNSFLQSEERGYFNFEHQESIGQPNWNLVKGKPWYRVQSYEWDYDTGSIGRRLTADEWDVSQAWQAFSAWEAMKKMRYCDYDGFSWCCLHGGANSVTYKKPLIDFMGNAKLAYWVNQMVFQKSVAGSNDVDVVWGPDDQLTPVILHWGAASTARLTIQFRNETGEVKWTKAISDISLPEGRHTIPLDGMPLPHGLEEGHYAVEYSLYLNR